MPLSIVGSGVVKSIGVPALFTACGLLTWAAALPAVMIMALNMKLTAAQL